jgi:hypothetical protein
MIIIMFSIIHISLNSFIFDEYLFHNSTICKYQHVILLQNIIIIKCFTHEFAYFIYHHSNIHNYYFQANKQVNSKIIHISSDKSSS